MVPLHKEFMLVYKGPVLDPAFFERHFAKTLPAVSALRGAMLDADTAVVWLKFAREIRGYVLSRAIDAHNAAVPEERLVVSELVMSANRQRLSTTDLYMRLTCAKACGRMSWSST